MRLREITDAEVMDYLDGNLSREEMAAIDRRLQDDSVAQELMDQYRMLYLSVEECGLPPLAPDFVDRVMAALPPPPPKRVGLGFKGNVAVVVFGLVFINMLAYLVDLTPVIETLGKIVQPTLEGIRITGNELMARLDKLSSVLPFLAVGSMLSLFYTFMDHIIMAPRTRRG